MTDVRGFAICGGCGRHVRGGESACPFCQALVTCPPGAMHTTPGLRPARAALLAGAAFAGALTALATGAAGCDAAQLPAYGGPPILGVDANAPLDVGTAVAAPVSALPEAGPSQDASTAPTRTPLAPDASARHPVMAPMYGAPPHRAQ